MAAGIVAILQTCRVGARHRFTVTARVKVGDNTVILLLLQTDFLLQDRLFTSICHLTTAEYLADTCPSQLPIAAAGYRLRQAASCSGMPKRE